MLHQPSASLYTAYSGLRNGNGGTDHGNGTLFLVTGRNLAHGPTITQVVPIVRISTPYVRLALELTEEIRARVAMGVLSLSDAAKANGLLTGYLGTSPAGKAAFGVAAGVNKLWDEVIAPCI